MILVSNVGEKKTFLFLSPVPQADMSPESVPRMHSVEFQMELVCVTGMKL